MSVVWRPEVAVSVHRGRDVLGRREARDDRAATEIMASEET